MALATVNEPLTDAAPQPIPPRTSKKTKPTPKKKTTTKEPKDGLTEAQFFEKVRAVPADDWGQRAFMYCYVTGPICDLRATGKWGYLFRSHEPILDLQKLLEDYGSFAGYLTLNRRKAGENLADQLDRFDFELYNPKYPPKIPRAAWKEDSRNQKWLALLPPEQAQPNPTATPAPADPLAAYKVIRDIQRDERERLEDQQPEAPDPLGQLATLMAVVKEMFPKPDNNNPLFTMLMAQITGLQQQLLKAEERQHEMQLKMLEVQNKPAPQDELTKKIVEKTLERALNPPDEAIPARARNQPWWAEPVGSLIEQLPSSPAIANLSTAALIWAQSWAQKNNGQTQHVMPPQPRPQPVPPRQTIDAPPATQEPQAQQPQTTQQQQPEPQPDALQALTPGMKLPPEVLAQFVGLIIEPLVNMLNQPDANGFQLREVVITFKGQMQYDLIRDQGADTLMQALRLSPFWKPFQMPGYPPHPGFAFFEAKLDQFIQDFCSDPPDEDEDEDSDEGDQVENDMKPEEMFR